MIPQSWIDIPAGIAEAPYRWIVLVRIVKSRGWKRHVWPFQCTPAPPRPVPGRNEPSCLIGSAFSWRLWRSVHVSLATFWKSS